MDEIKTTVQENLGAMEAVWTENADGPVQADVVIIRPGESANRRFYPKEALEEAVRGGFWDDAPMFLNHGDKAMPRKRQVEHLRAKVEPGTTYIGSEGEVRGRVSFFDPAFAKFVKAAGKHIGLSGVHEFMGQRYRGNDGHMHERVNKLVARHSVDFVAFPAAGGEVTQFLPAQESEDDVDYKSPLINADALMQHRPELVDELVALRAAETDDTGDDTPEGNPKAPFPAPVPQPEPPEVPAPEGYVTLAQAKAFAEESAERVVQRFEDSNRKKADTRQKVSTHVERSGLPDKAKAKLLTAFEGQEKYDSGAVQEAIEEMAEIAKEINPAFRGPKVVGMGTSTAAETDDVATDADTLGKLYPTYTAMEERMAFKPRKVAQEERAN